MALLVIGYGVLASVLSSESRRKRRNPVAAPTSRSRYCAIAGLIIALAALNLLALASSI